VKPKHFELTQVNSTEKIQANPLRNKRLQMKTGQKYVYTEEENMAKHYKMWRQLQQSSGTL
jgi:hypothetical protein